MEFRDAVFYGSLAFVGLLFALHFFRPKLLKETQSREGVLMVLLLGILTIMVVIGFGVVGREVLHWILGWGSP